MITPNHCVGGEEESNKKPESFIGGLIEIDNILCGLQTELDNRDISLALAKKLHAKVVDIYEHFDEFSEKLEDLIPQEEEIFEDHNTIEVADDVFYGEFHIQHEPSEEPVSNSASTLATERKYPRVCSAMQKRIVSLMLEDKDRYWTNNELIELLGPEDLPKGKVTPLKQAVSNFLSIMRSKNAMVAGEKMDAKSNITTKLSDEYVTYLIDTESL